MAALLQMPLPAPLALSHLSSHRRVACIVSLFPIRQRVHQLAGESGVPPHSVPLALRYLDCMGLLLYSSDERSHGFARPRRFPRPSGQATKLAAFPHQARGIPPPSSRHSPLPATLRFA